MKILLAITGLGVGGAERLVTALADRYVDAGHEVVLVYFHGDAEMLPVDSRVQTRNLEMRRSPLGVLMAMYRLRRLLKSFHPDVVNSHLVHANILIRLLRLFTSIQRLVSSAHNTDEGWVGRMLCYRWTDRLADISTNVSETAVKAFEHGGALRPGRMVTIHNGIDTTEFSFDPVARARVRAELDINESTPLLLAVGRLCEEKDYPNLIQAFARLPGLLHPPHLVIAGDGLLRRRLEAICVLAGVEDRVHFLGVRHDVPALMSACDSFVLSSAREGFGLVIAEAMACERPVVATDCGGVREVIGDAGFLVPPKNPEALAQAMQYSLELTTAQRQQLVAAARRRVVECYSLEVVAERYLKVYSDSR